MWVVDVFLGPGSGWWVGGVVGKEKRKGRVSDITGHISDANCFVLGNSNPLFIDGRDGPLIIDCLLDLAICLLFACPLQAVYWPFASYLGLYNTRCSAVSWQNQNATFK